MSAVPSEPTEDQILAEEKLTQSFYITFLFMLLFFFVTGAAIEKYKPAFGHETCATLILGVIVSLFLWLCEKTNDTGTFTFKQSFFFNFFLPPIIFNSGFNMRKKRFFQNLGNVALFGLVVTLVCFVVYSLITVACIKGLDLQMYNYYDLNNPEDVTTTDSNPMRLNMATMQILLFTSLLCSSDVVAAVSIVRFKEQPKLYSCIFGEGVFNDIVSIIIFNTVS